MKTNSIKPIEIIRFIQLSRYGRGKWATAVKEDALKLVEGTLLEGLACGDIDSIPEDARNLRTVLLGRFGSWKEAAEHRAQLYSWNGRTTLYDLYVLDRYLTASQKTQGAKTTDIEAEALNEACDIVVSAVRTLAARRDGIM